MQTIDDLDVAGRRVLVRADLNVPLADGRTAAGSPTTAGSGPALPTIAALAAARRPRRGRGPPGPPQGRGPARAVAAPVAAAAGRAARPAGGASPTDVVGESAHAIVAGLADGDVALLENLRFEAAETSKDDAERAALADRLAALARPLRQRRLRRGAPQAGQRLRRRAAAAARGRRPGPAPRSRCSRKVLDHPDRPVRRGPGRLQGLRQARRHRQPARPGRPAAGRRRDVLHLPRRAGPRGRRLAARGGPGRRAAAGSWPRRAERGVELVLPVDVVVAREFSADAETAGRRRGRDRARLARPGHRPAHRRAVRRRLADARTVVWNGPMGVFEMAPFADGHPRRRRGDHRRRRDHRGRRRRLGRRRARCSGLPEDGFTHISTGGGASLELLEGKTLPGLAVLEEDDPRERCMPARHAGP